MFGLSYASKLVGLLWGSTGEVEFQLDDEKLAKLSIIPAVAAVAASTTDTRLEEAFVHESDHPAVSLEDSLHDVLGRIRTLLARCQCHRDDDELGPVWVPTQRYPELAPRTVPFPPSTAQFCIYGHVTNYIDESVLIAPWLCPNAYTFMCRFGTNFHHTPVSLPDRHIAWLEGLSSHNANCKRDVPAARGKLSSDVLAPHFVPEGIYGYDRSCNIARCVWCFRDQVHFLNPAIFEAPFDVGRASAGNAFRCIVAALNQQVLAMNPRPQTVHITSWSSRFGPAENIPDFGLITYVLVNTQEDAAAVTRARRNPIMTWFVGTGRSLGNLRVYLAACLPVGIRGLVTDAFLKTTSIVDLSLPQRAPIECSPTHLNAACADMMLVAGGATNIPFEMPISRYAALAGIWGLEEAVVTRSTHVSFRADIRLSAFNLLWDVIPGMNRGRPIEFRSTVSDRYALASSAWRAGTVVTTMMVKRWSSNSRVSTAWWAASVLPVGRWEDPGPVEEAQQFARAPPGRGTPATISAAVANDVGVVNWYVFGSAGDIIPIRALARRLAGWGIKVRIVNTLTPEEGQAVLAAVEQGRTLEAAPHFLQAMLSAMTAPGIVFGPPEFIGVSVGVSLRPPPSIIYPADFGMGWLANFFLEAWMRTWAPVVNVGAYRGLYWLPRSADGETFLTTTRGGNRPIDIMMAWGSSTLPKPEIEGAVNVAPGDHYAQFTRARVVVTHGGAGTVQTAAAAGARVVAATTVLDRRYRDPLDAGRGTRTGADPDSVMLMLLPSTPKIWIWAYRHSWGMFWRAVRWSIYWMWLPALWLLAALSFKTFVFILHVPRVRVVFTTSFAGTLLATTMTGLLSPFWAMVLSPHIETLARYVLDHLGMTYLSLVVHATQFLAAASASSTTWAVLFLGGGWWSLGAYALVNMTKVPALLAAEMLSLLLTPVTQPPDGGWAYLSVTWAFEGSNIPIFHTRMVNEDRTRVYEGQWVNAVRGIGSIYRIRATDYVVKHPTEWVFPTRIAWSVLEAAPEFTAPYSPLWNCQSALLATTRGMWISLGVAGVVMAPMMVWTFLTAIVATAMALIMVAVIDFLPGIAVLLEASGHVQFLGPLRKICYAVLAEALNTSDDWYGSAMAMVVGYATGWATEQRGDNVFRVFTKICRAQDIATLSDMIIAGEIVDAVGLKLAQRKIAFLAGSDDLYRV